MSVPRSPRLARLPGGCVAGHVAPPGWRVPGWSTWAGISSLESVHVGAARVGGSPRVEPHHGRHLNQEAIGGNGVEELTVLRGRLRRGRCEHGSAHRFARHAVAPGGQRVRDPDLSEGRSQAGRAHDLELPVDDIEAAVDELERAGVEFKQYHEGPLKTNERGIANPGYHKQAWFKDPAGNILSVIQE